MRASINLMNKKEISIYLDGLSSGTETVFLRHLEAINHLSHYEESGVQSWLQTENAEHADLFFLGDDHKMDNPIHLARPILFDGVVPPALRAVAVSVKFPMTSIALKELMEKTIADFQPVAEDDSRKITIQVPEPKTHTEEKPAEKVEKVVKKPTKKSKTTEIKGDLPFFEGYLKTYQPKDQVHTLTFQDGKQIFINRLQGKIFADCENIRDLVAILATEHPKISDFNDNHEHLRAYPFDAVLWSYGLHAPLFDEIVKKFDIAGQKARLTRWPLFGKWETESKLLFLTTLFTQQAVSLREAEDKSEQDKDFVLHFMAAAELAGLPFELEQTNETEKPPTPEKKKVGWINTLRQKLNMSGN